MKKIVFALILLAGNSCTTFHGKSDWDGYSLKGKVKSITETSYVAIEKSEGIVKGEKGREISYEIPYLYDMYYLFDKNGRLLELTELNSNNAKGWNSKSLYKYDYRGKRTKFIYFADGIEYKHKYATKCEDIYDRNDNLTEAYVYNSDDSVTNKRFNKFNEKGHVVEMISDNPHDSLKYTTIFKYSYTGKNTISNLTICEPDSDLTTYNYNDMGYPIEILWYEKDGVLKNKHTYKYDEYGNKIEEIRFTYFIPNIPEKKFAFQYKYDSLKNWIRRVDYIDGLPKYIMERKIEYY